VHAPSPQISQPLVPLVDEFAARLFGELDYVQEGKSCEKFQVGGLAAHCRVCACVAHIGMRMSVQARAVCRGG
jgi:hypothetical protein